MPILVALAGTDVRSGPATRSVSVVLAGLTAVLVFFGVIVDMAHSSFAGAAADVGKVVEDGGELLAVRVLLSFTVFVLARTTEADPGDRRTPRRSTVGGGEGG